MRCACSSPAAPASSARTSSSALLARRRRGRRARQAHVRRQPGEPRRRATSELRPGRHRRRRRGRDGRATGCEAVVNFAAETHVDRSILGAAEFIETDVLGTLRPARVGRASTARGSSRSRPTRSTATSPPAPRPREDDPLRPSSPYSASKAGGDLQVLALRPHVRRRRLDHARLEHLRPEPVPGEADPAVRHQRARRPAAARSTATAARSATGSTSTTTARASSSCCARASPARSTTSAAATSSRTASSTSRILELTGRGRALVTPRRRPPGPRPPLLARHREAARRSAGSPHARFAERPAGDGRLVPREPRLVGADQVGRVPRVLRAAVRLAARLTSLVPARSGRMRPRSVGRSSAGAAARPCSSSRRCRPARSTGGRVRAARGRRAGSSRRATT